MIDNNKTSEVFWSYTGESDETVKDWITEREFGEGYD